MQRAKIARTRYRRTSGGSALMEYVVPAVLVLVLSGVIVTVTGIDKVLGQYFMAGSGYDKSALTGTTFKTDSLAANATGDIGTGWQGFDSYGSVMDGSGKKVASSGGGGVFYSGAITRSGPRASSANPEYLFP